MRQSVKLVKGTVTREYSSVGPRHDPYGRVTIRQLNVIGDPKWELILCGLAGVSFREFGGYEARATEHDIGMKAMEELVEKTTGMPIRFWSDKLMECKERALLARVGREEYERIQELREADERLLRYAM